VLLGGVVWSGNVIVFDRATGRLIDEKMPAYIRLGIRAIYRSKFGTVRKGEPVRRIGLGSSGAALANRTYVLA